MVEQEARGMSDLMFTLLEEGDRDALRSVNFNFGVNSEVLEWRRFIRGKSQTDKRTFIVPNSPEAEAFLTQLAREVSMVDWAAHSLGSTGFIWNDMDERWVPALRYISLPMSTAAHVLVWLERRFAERKD